MITMVEAKKAWSDGNNAGNGYAPDGPEDDDTVANWALLAWRPGTPGDVVLEGDAFDVAATFFAQIDAEDFNLAWEVAAEAVGEPFARRLLDAFST